MMLTWWNDVGVVVLLDDRMMFQWCNDVAVV